MDTDKRTSYIIIFSLWLLVFAASSQVMIISPILPRISEQLSTPESELGFLVTSYAVMLGIFAIIIGPVSDRVGRRKILLYGTSGMAVSLLLHGLVYDFWSLLLVRALSGMAGGVLSGVAVAYVGDYFPYEKRGWANGWIMSGIAMGQILGIPLGTVLAGSFGYKIPFMAFGVLMAMAFFLVLSSVPQPNVKLRKNRMSAIDAMHEYYGLLKRPDVKAVSFCYSLMFFSISLFIVYLPAWLENTFSVDGNAIATLFLVGGIANVISGPQAGKLSDKLGRRNIIIFSCLGLFVLMLATTHIMTSFWVAYPLFFFSMVLIAMRISPFQALSSELVTADKRGSLMCLLVAIGQIGNGLGSAFAGSLYEVQGYDSNTYLAAFTILLMAFVVWKFVPEPELKQDHVLEMS